MSGISEATSEPRGSWLLLGSPVGKVIVLAICIYVVLVSTPLIPLPLSYGLHLVLAGSLVATLLLAALSVAVIVQGARLQLSAGGELLLLVLCGGVWFGLARLTTLSHLNRLLVAPAASVIFLLGCLWLGRVVSRLFRDRGNVHGFFPAEDDYPAHAEWIEAVPNLDTYMGDAFSMGGVVKDSLGNALRSIRPVVVDEPDVEDTIAIRNWRNR